MTKFILSAAFIALVAASLPARMLDTSTLKSQQLAGDVRPVTQVVS